MSAAIQFVTARFDHGRWIADCPHCNGAEQARPGEKFTCGSHFAQEAETRRPQEPGIRAKDISRERGQEYLLHFPNNKRQIEKSLRHRPRHQMHWRPGDE